MNCCASLNYKYYFILRHHRKSILCPLSNLYSGTSLIQFYVIFRKTKYQKGCVRHKETQTTVTSLSDGWRGAEISFFPQPLLKLLTKQLLPYVLKFICFTSYSIVRMSFSLTPIPSNLSLLPLFKNKQFYL